ncbi:hypothetical protein AVEN_179645-1, partial [Araneus ventricosus]
ASGVIFIGKALVLRSSMTEFEVYAERLVVVKAYISSLKKGKRQKECAEQQIPRIGNSP